MTVNTAFAKTSPETPGGDTDTAERLVAQITSLYDEPDWLRDMRRRALETYRAAPMPSRVTHLWRYTDPLRFVPVHTDTRHDTDIERDFPEMIAQALAADTLAGAACLHKGFVGKIALEERLVTAGVRILDLHEAVEQMPQLIQRHLGSLAGPRFGKFEALINAAWTGGLLVYVPRGVDVTKPIHVFNGPGENGKPLLQRLLVIVEDNATLTLVDEYTDGEQGAGTHQNSSIIELVLGADARVRYALFQNRGPSATTYMTYRAKLETNAHLDTVLTSLGSETVKIDGGAILAGRGAESNIYGLAIGTGHQHFDHHTVQQHAAGSTYSDLKFKVALRDTAESVYTGRIGIDKQAPFCEAYQENRNLLLSPKANVETIPELEIMTNEVRCSHGATIGKIDPEEIFYLESRGIERKEAIRLIVTGFVGPIIEQWPETARARIHDAVLERLRKVTD